MSITFEYKVWLHKNGQPLMGKSRYELLKSIEATHSLKKSAHERTLSYRSVINYIHHMESLTGEKIILTRRGGAQGGGSVSLTSYGKKLLRLYEEACRRVTQ